MPPAELNRGLASPGDDYPNLDELLRQLPFADAGARIATIQRLILPHLWELYRGIRDEQGEFYSALAIREFAYSMAVGLTGRHYVNSGRGEVMPDVVALAGGQKKLPTDQPGGETSSATDPPESAPDTEAQ